MNIAAVFIVYFAIKETQFHRDTGACRGQYKQNYLLLSQILLFQIPHNKLLGTLSSSYLINLQ